MSVLILRSTSLLLVAFLILLEKFCELLVISELLLFHRHDLVDVCLEILQVVHKDFLISNKVIDISCVLS